MIKNIIFDIGRVLIGFEWGEYIRSLFDDDTAEKVTAAMWGTGYWKELDRATLTEEQILDLFYSAGPDLKDEILEAFNRVGECVKRREWAIPMIDDLKERGYRVLYLSNFSEHVMSANREALDFVSHMDGGIFSCDVKVIKPAADIYLKLIEKYDLKPEECIFIDDHYDNIAMAKKCGMKGIVFKSKEQFDADLNQALAKDMGHDRISVLCYGDSNTYGYEPATGGRYAPEIRWTTILQEKLGDHYEVIPEGLNGRTTAYDRPGAGWKNGISSFIACLGTHKPVDYLVIMLGTNDCVAGLGLTDEAIAKGMENLVVLAEEVSPELQGYVPEIIVTVPASIKCGWADDSPEYADLRCMMRQSRAIEPLYREMAERHMIRFASGTDAEVNIHDCTHLTENGHKQMADIIYNVLTEDPRAYALAQKLVP
ncbi:MAG: HAD family hydrolase [Clostridiales bacterium]|nr:HAD family hydrolase [Clostridiales bacterium]